MAAGSATSARLLTGCAFPCTRALTCLSCANRPNALKGWIVEGVRCSTAGSVVRDDREVAHIWGALVYTRYKDVSDSRAGLASSFPALSNAKPLQGLSHLHQKACVVSPRSSAKGYTGCSLAQVYTGVQPWSDKRSRGSLTCLEPATEKTSSACMDLERRVPRRSARSAFCAAALTTSTSATCTPKRHFYILWVHRQL